MAVLVSHEDLVREFGQGEVWRPDPDELFAGISDAGSRRFITEVGVPRSFANGIFSLKENFMSGSPRTMAQVCGDEGWPRDPSSGDNLYLLGDLGDGHLFIDGDSGRIKFFMPGLDDLQSLHESVVGLVYFMYAIYRDRPKYSNERLRAIQADPEDPRDRIDASYEYAHELVADLQRVDSTPFTGVPFETDDEFAGAWTSILEEIAGDQWGGL